MATKRALKDPCIIRKKKERIHACILEMHIYIMRSFYVSMNKTTHNRKVIGDEQNFLVVRSMQKNLTYFEITNTGIPKISHKKDRIETCIGASKFIVN